MVDSALIRTSTHTTTTMSSFSRRLYRHSTQDRTCSTRHQQVFRKQDHHQCSIITDSKDCCFDSSQTTSTTDDSGESAGEAEFGPGIDYYNFTSSTAPHYCQKCIKQALRSCSSQILRPQVKRFNFRSNRSVRAGQCFWCEGRLLQSMSLRLLCNDRSKRRNPNISSKRR